MRERIQQSLQKNLAAVRQQGSFARNFAVTLSGTTLVAAIGFLTTPFMSRIYPPASYGQFAVFSAVVSNLNLFTTLGYPGAMLMPRLRENFFALVHLSFLLTLAAVVVLGGFLLFASQRISEILHVEKIGNWLYTIPVLLLIYNLNAVMFTWYTREKNFTKRAGVDITTTITGKAFTIGYGLLFGGTVTGLLIGEFFNRCVTSVVLLWGGIWRELGDLWRSFSWQRIRAVATEYKDFPLYNLPASYVGALSGQLPIFALTTGFGTTVVGLYSFSVNLLELPINLIGNAVGPVFAQKAIETHNESPEKLPGITLELYNKLLYLGVIPFGLVTVFGDVIFKIIFGSQWEGAGLFTGFLGYYYIFKMASLATGGIYTVFGKQRILLGASVGTLLLRGATLGIGLLMQDIKMTMLLFGLGSLLSSFAVDLHILHMLRLPIWRIALRTILILMIPLILFYALRLGLTKMLGPL